MINLLQPAPAEPLLMPGHRHREAFFWTCLIVFDLLGLYTASMMALMKSWGQTAMVGVMVLLITDVALRFHRHNHDHLWLLAAAAVISVILAALWSVIYWYQILA